MIFDRFQNVYTWMVLCWNFEWVCFEELITKVVFFQKKIDFYANIGCQICDDYIKYKKWPTK